MFLSMQKRGQATLEKEKVGFPVRKKENVGFPSPAGRSKNQPESPGQCSGISQLLAILGPSQGLGGFHCVLHFAAPGEEGAGHHPECKALLQSFPACPVLALGAARPERPQITLSQVHTSLPSLLPSERCLVFLPCLPLFSDCQAHGRG